MEMVGDANDDEEPGNTGKMKIGALIYEEKILHLFNFVESNQF